MVSNRVETLVWWDSHRTFTQCGRRLDQDHLLGSRSCYIPTYSCQFYINGARVQLQAVSAAVQARHAAGFLLGRAAANASAGIVSGPGQLQA